MATLQSGLGTLQENTFPAGDTYNDDQGVTRGQRTELRGKWSKSRRGVHTDTTQPPPYATRPQTKAHPVLAVQRIHVAKPAVPGPLLLAILPLTRPSSFKLYYLSKQTELDWDRQRTAQGPERKKWNRVCGLPQKFKHGLIEPVSFKVRRLRESCIPDHYIVGEVAKTATETKDK